MKIEPRNAMPFVSGLGASRNGFAALMARMEKELWGQAPGGVVAGHGWLVPGRQEVGARRDTVANTGAAPAPTTAVPLAMAVRTTEPAALGAERMRSASAVFHARAPRAGLPSALVVVPVPERAPMAPREASPSSSVRASLPVVAASQQMLFQGGPGRVHLQWHAAGGVSVRLQLPAACGDAPDRAAVQAMLDHLRSRGVRVHDVTVNGFPYFLTSPEHSDAN